jgi:hypothetical protein
MELNKMPSFSWKEYRTRRTALSTEILQKIRAFSHGQVYYERNPVLVLYQLICEYISFLEEQIPQAKCYCKSLLVENEDVKLPSLSISEYCRAIKDDCEELRLFQGFSTCLKYHMLLIFGKEVLYLFLNF